MLAWQPKSSLGTKKGVVMDPRGICKELLSEVLVNVATWKLSGEFNGDFVRIERDKLSAGE